MGYSKKIRNSAAYRTLLEQYIESTGQTDVAAFEATAVQLKKGKAYPVYEQTTGSYWVARLLIRDHFSAQFYYQHIGKYACSTVAGIMAQYHARIYNEDHSICNGAENSLKSS